MAAALAAALVLAACKPDQRAASEARERLEAIGKTADQVQRVRKTDLLAKATPPPVTAPAAPAKRNPRAAPPTAPAIAAPPAAPAATRPPSAKRKPATPHPDPALAGFHRALRDLEGGLRHRPVTILHLGDSHIASDRVTGDLREMFQMRFGDAGRGLLMPGYPFPYYRARGVRFAKRGEWIAANSFAGDDGPFGLTGVRLSTREEGARLSLTSVDGAFEWAEVAFLTGPRQGTATVQVDGKGQPVDTRASALGVKRVRIEHKAISLLIRVEGDGPVSVLSWAVGHNRPGVRYVNLGIPGATADTPRRWSNDLVAEDIARLDPDLIVFGFGTNEGFNDRLDAARYEARVNELLARLMRAAPRASLAVIGPADGARFPRFAIGRDRAPCRALSEVERRDYARLKQDRSAALARWHAPPRLADVRAALKRVAAKRQAHFWDWSKMMGGPCAIHDWAQAEPSLAMKDHVHITAEGGRRSAVDFFASLMAGYDAPDRLASRDGDTAEQRNVR